MKTLPPPASEKKSLLAKPDKCRPLSSESVTIFQQLIMILMVLIFNLAASISGFQVTNLLLEKGRSSPIGVQRTETEAQIMVADLNTWKLTASAIMEITLATYIGPLTDRYGSYRIVMLYMPIVGYIVNDVCNCMHVYFWNWSPMAVALTECILTGCSGGRTCFVLLCCCYVSRLSTNYERTAKLGGLYCIVSFAMGTGTMLSGYLQTYLGLMNGFVTCILLNATALLLGVRFIRRVPEIVENEDWYSVGGNNVFSCVDVVRQKREHRKQLMIVLSLCTYPLLIGAPLGESSVLYLYLRSQFNWSPLDYSVYSFYHMLTILGGTLFCVQILSQRLHLQDTTIGIVGCTSDIVSYILRAVISHSWQMYAVAIFGLFHLTVIATILSIASKCVEPYEYGKLNALFSLMEGFAPFVYPIYNQVYRTTIDSSPNKIFLVSVSIIFPTIILFSIMRMVSNRSEKLKLILAKSTQQDH